MVKKNLRLSKEAILRIEEIWDYSVARFGLEQAEAYVRGLHNHMEHICTGHHDVVYQPLNAERIFYSRYEKHMIFYKKDHDVFVLTVLHGAMDIPVRIQMLVE